MKTTGPTSTIRNARTLRRDMTMPEVMLWQRLRCSPDGLRFRRQHPAGRYVLDFFCAPAKLVVEIDGIVHSMGDTPVRDERRDAFLVGQGLEVLRINAADVLRDAAGTAASVIAAARVRRPLHHAAHGPPPPKAGEDFSSEAVWNT